jgi:Sel1 repeat
VYKAAAVVYYCRAVDTGVCEALHNLGFCYENGDGVAEDKAEAVDCFRLAADACVATTLVNLGLCYENGNGVATDKAAAVEYYRRAADAEQAAAPENGATLVNWRRGCLRTVSPSVPPRANTPRLLEMLNVRVHFFCRHSSQESLNV